MKGKKISAKWIGIIVAAVAVLAMVIIFWIMNSEESEEGYRSIQIYKLEGTATIEREDIGSMAAVENLYLKSGDRIVVDENSSMRLKLDDDKYILVEEESVLSIEASGTKENSRTSIKLEKGAITNEIQKKLNNKSSYEVTTPNSVMAVRGTVFRVALSVDTQGEIYTKVATYEGKVGSRLIFPDNSIVEEVVFVDGGKEVLIHMDTEMTEYVSEPQNVDYNTLPVETLEFLKEVVENGTELSDISPEKLDEIIEQQKEKPSEKPENETTEDNTEDTTEESTGESTEESTEDVSEKSMEEPEATSVRNVTDESEAEENGDVTEKNTEREPEQENTESEETESETGESSTEETTDGETEEIRSFKVTFVYNGVVFGTQIVEEGQKVSVPKLSPDWQGAWDYDFSEAVTEDVTIYWK